MSSHSDSNTRNLSIPIRRCGSTPRLICYTQSNSERAFNYQRPPNMCTPELSGKSMRHVNPPPAREIVQFQKMNVAKLPDSKRTLVPDLAPEPGKIRVRCNSTSHLFFPYEQLKTESSPANRKMKTNFEMFDRKRRPENHYDPPTNDTFRKSTKTTVFSRYNKTTQIINLPGGVKRNLNDINDDKQRNDNRPCIRWDKPTSYTTKIFNDYKSSVACLPGSETVSVPEKQPTKPISSRRFQTNDIFNTTVSNNRTFRAFSGKKINNNKRSNIESTNDIYQNRFQGIKKSYKNYSQIQLC